MLGILISPNLSHFVNGLQLCYEFHGLEDGELVILNNSIFMNNTSWALQLPALTYDMCGHGQSEHPTSDYSLGLHADDLVARMEALGLRRVYMALGLVGLLLGWMSLVQNRVKRIGRGDLDRFI